ncbi:hypothetical protein C5B85_02715 [Pseudoclavibacter sp. AY1F1]|nr:hypothetical protein C5B85_02715 [Pseudoclavibacter sp. AY1F1]
MSEPKASSPSNKTANGLTWPSGSSSTSKVPVEDNEVRVHFDFERIDSVIDPELLRRLEGVTLRNRRDPKRESRPRVAFGVGR